MSTQNYSLALLQKQAEAASYSALAKRKKRGEWLPKEERRKAFQAKYRYDAAGFARDCINWARFPKQSAIEDAASGLAPYQEDVLNLLSANERLAVRACRGAGKSTTAAIAVLWFAETNDGWRDWKVVTSASTWKQLTDYLWPEIHKVARCLRWGVLGREPYELSSELLQHGLKLSTGYALAMNASRAEAEEGAHASAILYLYDEAKLIPDERWDSAEGALSTGEAKFLAISTPSVQSGRFYNIFQKRPGLDRWCTRHITLEEAVDAGRVSRTWVDERKAAWGETSSLYRMQVLGEFGQLESQGMIPLAWIDRARNNWQQWAAQGFPGKITQVGVDVGGGVGGDMSAVAVVYDQIKVRCIKCTAWAVDKGNATMELVGGLASYGREGVPLHIDAIGIGAGAYHRLHELRYNVYPFVSSAATTLMDSTRTVGFANWRAAGWGVVRDILDPDSKLDVCIPTDESINDDDSGFFPNSVLTSDLTVIKRSLGSNGLWRVSSKDDIRKEIGASPDQGDAVMMGLSGPILWLQRQTEEQGEGRMVYDPVRL